jgi:dipeptidyl aminopeptidase/acylaminoacyl peptidase
VLLTVHGGPYTQYGWTLFDETQTYVEAGYAVLQCNPRGSSGYGQAHGRVIKEHMGELDADDVVAFLDAALEDPALDASRVGLMGGSYGGFMTTLLLGRTDRFVAGISERAFNDPVSFVGSSDIGAWFADGYVGTDPERIAAQSPLAHAHRITTPTLVVHSEEDWRCPLEQGTRLYVELKRRGVPTELLLFPGEGHELSRSGRPKHRLARLEHVLRWWARWLPTARNQPAVGELSSRAPAGPPAPEPSPSSSAEAPGPDAVAAVDGEASGRRGDMLTVPATRL